MKKLMLILAAVLTGCASLQNTPQQNLIWNAYPLCKAEIRNNVQILRVDPDGRYWMQCTDACYALTEFNNCISEKVRAQRASQIR